MCGGFGLSRQSIQLQVSQIAVAEAEKQLLKAILFSGGSTRLARLK